MPNYETGEVGQYADRPGAIPWQGWRQTLLRVKDRMMEDEIFLRCAGVAFYGLLSVFPAIGSGVLIYGLVTDPATLQSQLDGIRPFLPAQVFALIANRLEALASAPDVSLGFGLLLTVSFALWSGTRGTNELIHMVATAYREKDKRGIVRSFVVSVAMTVAGALFIVFALFTIAAIPAISALMPLPIVAETIAAWGRWPLIALMAILGMAAIYRISPSRREAKWRWIWPGATAAASLWIAASIIFSLYVELFGHYDATFGSISAAVVLMLWFYYSALIVAAGAELNAELEMQTARDTTIGPDRPMGEREAYVADHVAARVPQHNADAAAVSDKTKPG